MTMALMVPRSGCLVGGVHEAGEEAAGGAEGGAGEEGGGGVEAGRGGGRGQQQRDRDQVQWQPVPGQHVGAALQDMCCVRLLLFIWCAENTNHFFKY